MLGHRAEDAFALRAALGPLRLLKATSVGHESTRSTPFWPYTTRMTR
jgi:hypothetical protein